MKHFRISFLLLMTVSCATNQSKLDSLTSSGIVMVEPAEKDAEYDYIVIISEHPFGDFNGALHADRKKALDLVFEKHCNKIEYTEKRMPYPDDMIVDRSAKGVFGWGIKVKCHK